MITTIKRNQMPPYRKRVIAVFFTVFVGCLLQWGCSNGETTIASGEKNAPPPPQVSTGAVTWDLQSGHDLGTVAFDVATSQDGKFVFSLARGAVLVFDTEKKAVVDTIPVDKAFDAIDISAGDLLVLTGNGTQEMRLLQIERVYDIDISNRAFRGKENASVVVAVFDDYQCPYCSKLESTFKQVLVKYPDDVKVVIKHFPLSSHRFAVQAAKAALAADRQGKFWEFHEKLFESYKTIDLAMIDLIAQRLGLDMAKFKADAASPEIQGIIVSDMENGRRIGVRGTPSVYIGGKPLNDRSLAGFSAMIEAELKRKGAAKQ